jgi:heat-inducible transcriptional repressor
MAAAGSDRGPFDHLTGQPGQNGRSRRGGLLWPSQGFPEDVVLNSSQDRNHQVLVALVQLFIERREPVSSRMLDESGLLDIRSASIRSVLKELEDRGYLHQPHASSGRIPTDRGYRAYVDAQELDGDGTRLSPEAVVQLTRAIRAAGEDVEQVLRAVTRVVGDLSSSITILGGPREKSPEIVGVDLYHRDSQHVLVVISLEGGSVRTQLVRLDREILPESLWAAATLMGDRLAGRTLEEVRHETDRLFRPATTPAAQVAEDLTRSGQALFDPGSLLRFTWEGVNEALHQPEFADADRLKALLHLMSHSEEFEVVLERLLRQQSGGEIALTIGQENRLPALQPFALLATRFEIDDREGYFAVLGPRRMPYARNVTLIRLIARHLERLSG